jgi:hypothetical protein
MSYVSAMTIGIYSASQFKYKEDIELHRWCITILCLIFFLIQSNEGGEQ